MKFLVDECTGPAVAHWLRMQGHEVFSVYEEARGKDIKKYSVEAIGDFLINTEVIR